MKKRYYLIAFLIALTGIGAWTGYRHLRTGAYATLNPAVPPAPDQKIIRFGFDGVPQADGVPAPWESHIIKGKLLVEQVDSPEGALTKALRLKCEKSHFLIVNGSTPFNAEDYPIVKWSWKVASLPTNADVRVHNPIPFMGDNRNDAAVQVLVGFEGKNVLSYIWDSTAPVGTEVEEPSPVATVRTHVLDSGPAHLNEWISHSVNIVEDYRRRFGKAPGKVLGISVQTNSNHTASTGDGTVAAITAQSR